MCQYISQQVEKRERDNESDDVESNLLLPAGIALRWVTFLLKIYRAEDIPQSTSVLLLVHWCIRLPLEIPVIAVWKHSMNITHLERFTSLFEPINL